MRRSSPANAGGGCWSVTVRIAALLTRTIAAAGLTERTLLTGRVDDRTLHAWYEAAHLFVHPTLYEGSSLVTLEAMAHRRAVVATNAGGLPDKIVTGRNGWLVPAGDPSALAAAVSGALGPRRGPGRSRRARPDGRRAGVFVGHGWGRDHPTLREPAGPRAKLTQFFLGLYAPRNGRPSARYAPHRAYACLGCPRARRPSFLNDTSAASVACARGHRDGTRAATGRRRHFVAAGRGAAGAGPRRLVAAAPSPREPLAPGVVRAPADPRLSPSGSASSSASRSWSGCPA